MVISAISASQGNPGLALGNAYGSNIANIALVLGLTALIQPITVHPLVLRRELPVLFCVTLMAVIQLWDGSLSRIDAWILLAVFCLLMTWNIMQGFQSQGRTLNSKIQEDYKSHDGMSFKKSLVWLFLGLALLIISSRLLVWGAVQIAQNFGISDLIIGLSIVAIGTSLPELASSVIAIYKNEHDMALGTILGSNLFNTLTVVGIAGAIHPMSIAPEVLYRDCMVMGVLILSLFFIGKDFIIKRYEGVGLLSVYLGYTVWLAFEVLGK
jgi:cation:H+ antiporter